MASAMQNVAQIVCTKLQALSLLGFQRCIVVRVVATFVRICFNVSQLHFVCLIATSDAERL